MDTNIIGAIVGGFFAILAALIPIVILSRQRAKEKASTTVYTPPEGLSAVIGIVQKGQEVLMVQRRKRIRDLSWQFPAGVVKPDTDLRDKIEREVFQETGVRCKVKNFLGGRIHEDTQVYCNYVHCEYLEGQASNLDPEENAQVVWVHVNDVRRYITSSIYIGVDKLLDEIMENAQPNKVALGIVISGGNVLVVRRNDNDNSSDWRFPGGTVEIRELEGEAAAREVAEETGIISTPVRKIGERVHPDTGQIVAYWLCNYESGQASLMEPDKFSEVVWMRTEDVITTFGDKLFDPVKSYLRTIID